MVGAFALVWEPRVSGTGMSPSTKELCPRLRCGTYVGYTVLKKEKPRCTRFFFAFLSFPSWSLVSGLWRPENFGSNLGRSLFPAG